jgi:cbb3-type cytochrome oxidase subunit 3
MAKLKDRIKTALSESRMLILGAQVLLGFQYRAVFETGFDKLPFSSQYLKLCGLCLMLVAVGLLMSPGAFHRIVDEGEDTERVHRFTSNIMGLALMPFALGFSLDLYVATEKLMGRTAGIVAGAALGLLALFFWYGLEAIRRREREPKIMEKEMDSKKKEQDDEEGTKLKDKIDHALTEMRVVLPGAQALLGFQFASMLVEGFDKLPASSKYVHLASLMLIAITVVLLMTPAAYHRIVERGQETQHFHSFASRMLIAAMLPLALGMCGDFFVVIRKITNSTVAAITGAALMLLFFYGLWFGYTLYRRGQQGEANLASAANDNKQYASR